MSAYYRFPEYRLASGRYIMVEIFTQDISSGISAPYTDPGGRVDLTVNPWLQEGVPLGTAKAQPAAGLIGSDAAEFAFAGIPVHGTKSLYTLIHEQPPDQFLWNIRYYVKASAAASYPTRPRFWGVIDRAIQYGELRSMTRHELNTYKMTATNRAALLGMVRVEDWTIPWKTTLAITPSAVVIDGDALNKVLFTDDGSSEFVNPTDMRFLSLRELVNSMADDIACTTSVNALDTIRSSWTFYGKNASGVETAYTADDLVVASGTDLVGHSKFGTAWYWHWSYFDHEKRGDYSVYNAGTLLEVFKSLFAPIGLTASLEVTPHTGLTYIELREIESRAGVKLRYLLRDKTLSVGENSAGGFVVNIANDGEFALNGMDGEQIECPYMSAARIRAGERWVQGGLYPKDTDDLWCLYGSLWIYDSVAGHVTNVTKIDVKSDGRDSLTVGPASASLNTGGKLIAEAAARYWYNNQNTTVSRLGYHRPNMRELELRDLEIRDDVVGTTTGFATDSLACTGAFTDDGDTYLHRRVRNLVTGAESVVTAKVNDDMLSIDDDIFPSAGQAFIVLPPRIGDAAFLPDGSEWRIIEMSVNDREGTTDFLLESEAYG